MNYKIIQFNQEHGVITIEYEDGITINFDLPIVDKSYPDDEALEVMIQNIYPASYALRLKETQEVLNSTQILLKVETAPTPDITGTPVDTENTNSLEQEALLREEIIKIVKQVASGEL